MAIQEEIIARRISIVNDAGQEVVKLFDENEGGVMVVTNKDGTLVAGMGVNENDNGEIRVYNKNRNVIGNLP